MVRPFFLLDRRDAPNRPQKRGIVGFSADTGHRAAMDDGLHHAGFGALQDRVQCHLPPVCLRTRLPARSGRGEHTVPSEGEACRSVPFAQPIGARPRQAHGPRRTGNRAGHVERGEKRALARHRPPVAPRPQRDRVEERRLSPQAVRGGLRHRRGWSRNCRCRTAFSPPSRCPAPHARDALRKGAAPPHPPAPRRRSAGTAGPPRSARAGATPVR